MTYYQIANISFQYDRNLNYYLKFYAPNTTTPLSMATDSTGSTLLAKAQINSQGFPTTDGTTVFIPHLAERYDAYLFPNATDADNNVTTNAIKVADNSSPNITSEVVKTFDTLNDAVADISLQEGDSISLKERTAGNGGGAMWVAVLASTVTVNSFDVVACTGVPTLALALHNSNELNLYQFGAKGDGVTDDTDVWAAWEAYAGSKTITPGSYLVSGVVKVYSTPTYVNTTDNNHSSGLYSLETNTTGENNTAFGKSALQKTEGVLPLGSNNSAFGFEALGKNTEGYRNCAFGYQALHEQQGNLVMGNSNHAFGYQALYNNTTGKDNLAFGYLAMFSNVAGGGNVSVGYRALYNNIGTDDGAPNYAAIDGSFNVAVGYESMLSNTYGKSNTAIGWRCLLSNTTGYRNTAIGQESMSANITGNNNFAAGYFALAGNVNGSDNVAIGYEALLTSTGGLKNIAIGRESLHVNTSGNNAVAVGYQSLAANVGGVNNVGIGYRALSRNTSGNSNTAIGYQALEFTTAGGSNLGFSNCSGLGNNSRISASNQVQLGDSLTTTYAYGAVQDRSDMRDKLDIKDLTDAHIAFFMDVQWKQYRMNHRERYVDIVDGSPVEVENDGSRAGTRFHIGAIAQQVESVMKKHNIDFAGLQHHKISGGEDVYTIGYQEFIGIQGLIIQKQQSRILSIEERLNNAGI